MGLLVTPQRRHDEGPLGYRFRLARSNLISVQELRVLEISGEVELPSVHAEERIDSDVGTSTPWIHRWSRFCPHCLQSRDSWLMGWEVVFADACAQCGRWLADTCSLCRCHVLWRRDHLLHCSCGHPLTEECTSLAPDAVIRLSRALQSVALRQEPTDIPIFHDLSLSQCVRVVRLLGAYGNAQGRSVPQKILDVDKLEVSWPISSMAAEIFSTWPTGFYALAKSLQRQSSDQFKGTLSKTFGGFYFALYRGFKDDEFRFLRSAFEDYLAEHWTGGIARRNRRLDTSVLNKMVWIPANEACRKLCVSRRRLQDLIEDGQLRGETRSTNKNRQFVVVNRSDIDHLALTLNDGLNLEATADRLGLKKQRLLALLPFICPDAKKLGGLGCPWSIPVNWVEDWETLIQSTAEAENTTADTISLGQLLRYWPWTEAQIGKLLINIHARTIPTCGRLSGVHGLGSLALSVDCLRAWFSSFNVQTLGELTLPEVALRLDVKQEVIYSLARSGLIQVTLRKSGRRLEQRMSFSALKAFEIKYVFGREIAQKLKRSPRSILHFFQSEGVDPVAGPGIDDCRQLLFERHAVITALNAFPCQIEVPISPTAIRVT